MDNLHAKLLKVKALAEEGVDGEREAARAVLNRLMLKHGLPEIGLSAEPVQSYDFSYKNKYEKRILIQICAKVTRQSTVRYRCASNRARSISVALTPDQYQAMKSLYSVYRKAFEKELERVAAGLIDAFIHKHDLWSGAADDQQTEPMTAEEGRLLRDLYRNLEEVELDGIRIPKRFSLRFAAESMRYAQRSER